MRLNRTDSLIKGIDSLTPSKIRPISQVTIELRGDDAFAEARSETLKWITEKSKQRLPDHAWDGQAFKLPEAGAFPTEAVTIENRDIDLWAIQFTDPDSSVAQRSWTTEVVLGRDKNKVLLGVRLLCASYGKNPYAIASVPRLVRNVINRTPAYLSDVRLTETARIIDTEEDIDWLVTLLKSNHRYADVVVFSLPSTNHTMNHRYSDSAHEVARRALGAVYTACITKKASYMLTSCLEKEFSVFGGAVRTYRPGFNPSEDDPFDHPLALATKVSELHEQSRYGISNILISQILQQSITRRDAEERLQPYVVLRRHYIKSVRARSKLKEQEFEELLDEQNVQQEESDEAYEGLLEDASNTIRDLRKENQLLIAKVYHLTERNNNLEEQRIRYKTNIDDITVPNTLSELHDWASKELSGLVVILNRALQKAKKSPFGNPRLFYQSLLLLRDFYVPMKRKWESVSKSDLDNACKHLGIELTKSITNISAGKEGDEYYVSYKGKKKLMDMHIKKGNSRDEKYCLRVYFFWDPDEKIVVVGSLPGHLDTQAT